MADYWKSQAKKFCDFCKCWLADNKPSIEFHEKGKRHKENVQRRLGEITKKSIKEEKAKLHVDAEIRKMEKAAMKAYLKDVELNPDYTSHIIQEMGELPKSLEEAKTSSSTSAPPNEIMGKNKKNKNVEKPKGNFGSNYSKNKEKNKSLVVEKVDKEIIFGPAPKAEPYGMWKTVELSGPGIDLQLPEQPNAPEYNVPELSEEPRIKFKEKQIDSLGEGSSGSVSFKKRKVNMNQKRNVRQRLDEND